MVLDNGAKSNDAKARSRGQIIKLTHYRLCRPDTYVSTMVLLPCPRPAVHWTLVITLVAAIILVV